MRTATVKRQQVDDQAVLALLDAHAAERGGRVVIEEVNGRWRAGFVVQDDLGEGAIELSGSGRDRPAALHQLLVRTADALERSARLAEDEAEMLERAGRSDESAAERCAADRARQAAQLGRSYAEEWPEQARSE